MAGKHEQNAEQSAYLFELLDLQARNPGIKINGLKAKIHKAMAVMSEPDITWVEKQIAEVYKDTDAK